MKSKESTRIRQLDGSPDLLTSGSQIVELGITLGGMLAARGRQNSFMIDICHDKLSRCLNRQCFYR